MKKILKAFFLLIALSAVPLFAQSDFEAIKARAEAGDAEAQRMLGKMYRDGDGVSLDENAALKWFLSAAEQGEVDAQLELGDMYDIGLGVAENDQEAVKWYRFAAEQGHAQGQYFLGVMYEEGKGLAQNDQRAYIWYSVAAEKGVSEAASARDRTKALLTPQALQEAQALAKRLSEYSYKDCGE